MSGRRGANQTHGESFATGRTPEYVAWVNMIQRCHNDAMPHWADYGGRGVRVCEEWRDPNTGEVFDEADVPF